MSVKNEIICDVCGEPIDYLEQRYFIKPSLFLCIRENTIPRRKDICKYCFKEFKNYIQNKKEEQKSAT